jgi:hypothetical protein
MISKVVKGSHSGSVIRYLINPAKAKDATIVTSNIKGDSIDRAIRSGEAVSINNYHQIKEEVDRSRLSITENTKKYTNNVTHIAVGFDPKDGEVSRINKKQVAVELLDRLGYKLTPFLVVEHRRDDPGHPIPLDHDHIHIWTVPINYDGKLINTRNDYYAAHDAMRQIEEDLCLTPFLYHNQREPSHVEQIKVIPQYEDEIVLDVGIRPTSEIQQAREYDYSR